MKQIAIHSVPRSGSTWLGEIFNSHSDVIYKYQPLFSYAFKDKLSINSTKEDIKLFYEDLIKSEDDFLNQTEARMEGRLPTFKKKEQVKCIVYKEVRYHHILRNALEVNDQMKVIGLVRNPLAVINSWLNAPREFRQDLGWKGIEEWRFAKKKNLNKIEEYNGFEKWKEVTILFQKLEEDFPNQFKMIKYDNLISDTENVVKELFSFCSLPFVESTKEFISLSKAKNNIDAYSVFKTFEIDDKWKLQLNKRIIDDVVNELKNTILEEYII